MFRRADAFWERGASRASNGDVVCRAGCFGCCIGLFEISLAEALLVRDAVRRLPEEVRRDVIVRCARIVDETATRFPGDAPAGLLDPERTDARDAGWFDGVADRACPMLELPSGRCRIYESRPITCRTYGLAWRKGRRTVHPCCGLNFVGSGRAGAMRAAIDARGVEALDREIAETVLEAELPAGAATTIAHAIVGTAFGRRLAPKARKARTPSSPL